MVNEWIYFGIEDSFRKIVSVFSEDYDIEAWTDMGIIEVAVGKSSIDFEMIEEKRWDDFSKEHAAEFGYNKMYIVTVSKDAEVWAEEFMKAVCQRVGGRFCADSENLEPHIE